MARARVYVTFKEGVLDPQGQAVLSALRALGHVAVEDVRVGKLIELTLKDSSRETLEQELGAMCRGLLANPVIEDFRFELS